MRKEFGMEYFPAALFPEKDTVGVQQLCSMSWNKIFKGKQKTKYLEKNWLNSVD